MTSSTTTYVISVDSHLDEHWRTWLTDVELTLQDDGTTTITIAVVDQAQLHGVLARLRDIGLVLKELRRSEPR